MSRSYRTEKESITAKRNALRTKEDEIWLPRIIVRKPAKSDVHPLDKKTLAKLLRKIPIEYLYKLDRIEMRARIGTEIGRPYGVYWPDEKAIILYSLPMRWDMEYLSKASTKLLETFGAEVKSNGKRVNVTWKDKFIMGLWFYCDVVSHEIGHHFEEAYKHKNKAAKGRVFEEIIANMESRRFTDELFRVIKNPKSNS